MLNAYIYDGLRTPIGRHAGKLSSVRPDDLAAPLPARRVLPRRGEDTAPYHSGVRVRCGG